MDSPGYNELPRPDPASDAANSDAASHGRAAETFVNCMVWAIVISGGILTLCWAAFLIWMAGSIVSLW
jgi:hypothetical protein